MKVKKVVVKEILLVLVVVGVSFLFGYLMRNVPIPPDCISDPRNVSCTDH